ncbi:hypothetical protein [Streptosporangium longisporum]|uniref:Uncharacterized protein n=1 Tax=Streptosporangium longisporum TaxID=46187 RepID=A0ABP6KZ16_9ACTN
MGEIPARPYTLIYQPAPGGVELRLLRSALRQPGVVVEIAHPGEGLTGGRMLRVDAEDLWRILAAAEATAALPPDDEKARRALAEAITRPPVTGHVDVTVLSRQLLEQQAQISMLRTRAEHAEAACARVQDEAARWCGEAVGLEAAAVRLTRQLLRHADTEPAGYLEWLPADILEAAEQQPADNDDDSDGGGGGQEGGAESLVMKLGDYRDVPCPACGETLLASTVYWLTGEGLQVVGGVAVCVQCGTSPYTAMDLP